ncbi:30S ribosomal protein S6e [Candidatus Bathyarchaeota archaeon]|nr:30S ribosomal protein S6e [Candidatus Bathyarchaeota archaeon]
MNTQFLIERYSTFIPLLERSSLMAKFKIIVSDPGDGTSKVVELAETRAMPLIGRRIGEIVDGSIVDTPGQKVQIMGGSDKDGFPMRPSVHGGVRRRIILSGGVGFNPQNEGARKRKTVRGNVITDEIVQVNLKITEKTKKPKENKKPKKKREPTEKEAEKETAATNSTA